MAGERKVRTTVYLPEDLLEDARALDINLSEVLKKALVVEISLREILDELFESEYLSLTIKDLKRRLEERKKKRDDDSGAWDDESGAP